jgi:hypothetical protein
MSYWLTELASRNKSMALSILGLNRKFVYEIVSSAFSMHRVNEALIRVSAKKTGISRLDHPVIPRTHHPTVSKIGYPTIARIDQRGRLRES